MYTKPIADVTKVHRYLTLAMRDFEALLGRHGGHREVEKNPYYGQNTTHVITALRVPSGQKTKYILLMNNREHSKPSLEELCTVCGV